MKLRTKGEGDDGKEIEMEEGLKKMNFKEEEKNEAENERRKRVSIEIKGK